MGVIAITLAVVLLIAFFILGILLIDASNRSDSRR